MLFFNLGEVLWSYTAPLSRRNPLSVAGDLLVPSLRVLRQDGPVMRLCPDRGKELQLALAYVQSTGVPPALSEMRDACFDCLY